MNGEMKISVDFIPKKDNCTLVNYHALVISAEFKKKKFIDEFNVLSMDFMNNLEDLYGVDRLFVSDMNESERHNIETIIIRLIKALAFFEGYSNRFPWITKYCLTKFETLPQFDGDCKKHKNILSFEVEILKALDGKILYIDF